MKKTFKFLKQLKKNNNRDWFEANRNLYQDSLDEMTLFAEELIREMNTHDQIETPSAKKSLFRIYRDVRFSKDKTPYKTNWGGRMQRATAALRGGYYYQIEPGNSFIIGGFFGPNAEDLQQIRKHLAQDADPLLTILNSSQFISLFGELSGAQLKLIPRGFEKDHPQTDLLRYKQFVIRKSFDDELVLSGDFTKIVSDTFHAMRPFYDYMSEILTTDLNGESLLP